MNGIMSGVVRGSGLGSVALTLLLSFTTARAGELEQFFYANVEGAHVSDLQADPSFPEQPFDIVPVNWFSTGLEGITNASNHYGSWMRGYLEAPVTGDYVFYLSADDSADFYLSADYQPENKALIASVQTKVAPDVYDGQAFQRSVPVTLEKGKQYFFEILHRQDEPGDHVQVGWLRPDDVLERPVPLRYVQRFVPESYFVRASTARPCVRQKSTSPSRD